MLILGQNYIYCGHNVVNFSVWLLQLTVFKYLVASHVTEPGWLLTEPFAVTKFHCNDFIMSAIASQITNLTIVYSTDYSDADQRKHQSSASLAFVNSPDKWPVTRKMVPFDDVIMLSFQQSPRYMYVMITLWGRVTHVCISKLIIVGPDNGLWPGRHQAIIWSNTAMLWIRRGHFVSASTW